MPTESPLGGEACHPVLPCVLSAPGARGGCRATRNEASFGLDSPQEVCEFESSFQNIQRLLTALFSTLEAPHGLLGLAHGEWHLELHIQIPLLVAKDRKELMH